MSSTSKSMLTVGEISRRLQEPLHRIEYIIRSRNIHPTGTAGNSRVFSTQAMARIADHIRSINLRRGPAPTVPNQQHSQEGGGR